MTGCGSITTALLANPGERLQVSFSRRPVQLPGKFSADGHGREGSPDHSARRGGQAVALAADLCQRPTAHGRPVLQPHACRPREGGPCLHTESFASVLCPMAEQSHILMHAATVKVGHAATS